MTKSKLIRRLALLFSVVLLLTSTLNTTFGYIVVKTDSLINIFKPLEEGFADLLIGKKVEHPFGEDYKIPDNISFDFKIDFGAFYANTAIKTTDGNLRADANGSLTVSLKPGRVIGIQEIDAGTEITVTELQKEGSGFAVSDGVAVKEGVVPEEDSLCFEYVNVYSPASVQPLNVTVGGTKTLEGRDWKEGDTFSFVLEQYIGEDQWRTIATESIAYDPQNPAFNTFDFTNAMQALTFEQAGTYAFRMTEAAGRLDNIDYDKTVNTFAVKVTDVDMDGKLEIGDVSGAQNTEVLKENGRFAVSVAFNNTFIPSQLPTPDGINVDVYVHKTVKNIGGGAVGPEGFEFVLENDQTGEKLALHTNKDGYASVGLPFTAADIGKTYTYRLYETNEGMIGMTYDADVYTVEISVSLTEENTLLAKTTLNGKPAEKLLAEFINIYRTNPSEPSTGDASHRIFWIAMMAASGISCILLLSFERRCRKKEAGALVPRAEEHDGNDD